MDERLVVLGSRWDVSDAYSTVGVLHVELSLRHTITTFQSYLTVHESIEARIKDLLTELVEFLPGILPDGYVELNESLLVNDTMLGSEGATLEQILSECAVFDLNSVVGLVDAI